MNKLSATVIVIVATLVAPIFGGLAGAASGDRAKAPVKHQKLRYKGTSRSGHPIKFTVLRRPGRDKVRRLSVDVVTECWDDQNGDGVPDEVVAHITGLKGSVSADGSVEVFYSPDEDTEYVVQGDLTKRAARLNVVVGGYFGPDGVPNAGDLQCDNWGAVYKAKRRAG